MNLELAHSARNGEPQFWDLEVMPIFGFRTDRWHLAANPGITVPLTGAAWKTTFDPAAKIAYRTFDKNYFGIEYYLQAGPVRHWLPSHQRSQVLYFAWDGKIAKSDINVGIGRGFSDASDRWVLKAIYEISF